MQCIKVAGDHIEWEQGGNRSVHISEGPCQVAFDWGDEGSLRVESVNGKAPSSNGAVEAVPEQAPASEVRRPCEALWKPLSAYVCIRGFLALAVGTVSQKTI